MKKTTNLPPGILKIVLIYEFHQMSPEAQMALRRIIEQNSHKIRFIFLTEDPGEVIQALQSRCTIMQMQKLTMDEIDSILRNILVEENIDQSKLDIPGLLELIKLNADGDIRIAVNLLQLLVNANNSDWYEILGIPEISNLKKVIQSCIEHKPLEAYKILKQLTNGGFEICDVLDMFSKVLVRYPRFPQKKEFVRTFCQQMLNIEECYTETQFFNLFNQLANLH
jgi:DNA polymerase III delta prime subunit